ncbi:MAG TPA: SPOR domain-containing protein [Ramlibacter sp.]|uniref:SPOR domain-containing protein n=1 Tax=Ramlibacter sp. TaxID=1917967 RepID=UPI002ED0C2F2
MALFKSRKKKVDEPVAAASPAESIEVMRRRARHRLIGAVVLVLAGVIGFPILFDTQPRPVAVDIPIEIPDRNKVPPLQLPTQPPVASGKVTPAPAPAAAAPVITETRPEPAPVAKVEAQPAPAEKVAKPEPAAEKKPEPRAETAPETAKAKALLEGRSVDASGLRYVVQVGAFAERDKAMQAQRKLERAGLKNYTNVAETRDGKRIRVRAGPFATRAEADKAAARIKGLDLPAAVLTL